MRPVNLARRPHRNERLPNVLAAAALLFALGTTAVHAMAVRRLLPDRTSARHRELAALDAEFARLREEAAGIRSERADEGEVARWTLIKEIVDRRAFSWTGLFERLETLLPDGVRLVSVAPSVQRGEMLLDIAAVSRTAEDGWELVRVLEAEPDFSDVFPRSEGEQGEFRYTMRYHPAASRRLAAPSLKPGVSSRLASTLDPEGRR